MTKYLKETLYSYFNYDRNSYHNNIETFKLRNTRILKVVVVASILINLSNFIANCIHVNPSIMRGSYLTIIIFSSIIYLYLCVKEKLEYMFLIYIIYSILVAFTIYSSAFIMPDYIGFGIIAYIFFLPVLFIDKSWRINSLVIVFAAIYLGIVLPFKVENLRID